MLARTSLFMGVSLTSLILASNPASASGLNAEPAPLVAAPAEQGGTSSTDEKAIVQADIIVTGTRLPSTFTAPTPVTVVSADQLRTTSPSSVGEALAQLPAFSGSQVTSNLGRATSNFGAAQALLNLRNLGANRTLVLLDGERLPASNVNGSVDVNVIPQALLSRVDVVTGGASASYGSDAVAGVANFVLDTRFKGIKGEVSGGQTTYGDAKNIKGSLAGGWSFNDGRGRLVASIDYFNQTGIGLAPNGRDWFDHPAGFVTLPAGSATTFGIIPDARYSTMSFGGLVIRATNNAGKAVTVAGLSNYQFATGGGLTPFDFGTNTGSSFQSGGSGPVANNGLSPKQERINAFAHLEYDFSDTVTVFAEGLYARSFSDAESVYAYQPTTRAFTLYSDNAYVKANSALSALMSANNLASITVARLSADIPPLENRSTTTLARGNVGVKWKISPTWSFDASAAYASSRQLFGEYMTINRNLYAAADAVTDPVTGNIVCRSTLSGLDAGCVPINVMGPNAVDPKALSYISGWDWGDTRSKQATFSANIRGDLGEKLSLGAGPIAVALGTAYRSETTHRTVSPLSNITTSCTGLRASGCAAYNNVYGGYQTYNPAPLDGVLKVFEAYGELGVPLLKDAPFIRSLDVTLAGRATHYSTSGWTYTWKIGPSWQVTDELRLRITRSQDIRAPTVSELFSTVSGTGSVTSVLYPNSQSPGPLATTTVTVNTGNLALQPEVAQTLTIGAVYKPAWLYGFQASLDYYSIDLSGAITTIATQSIVDGCSAGNQAYCSLITVGGAPISSTAALNGATGISVRSAPINVAKVTAKGLDAEMSYATDLAGGKLTLRAIGNLALERTNSASIAPTGPVYIGAYGLTGGVGVPRWTLSLREGYEHPLSGNRSIGVNLEERIISAGHYNPNYTSAQFPDAQNNVPAYAYTNATLRYSTPVGGAKAEFFLTIQNLMNTTPPAIPAASTFQAPTNFELYDVLGRRWTLGVRAKL